MKRFILFAILLFATHYGKAREVFPLSSDWNFSYGYDISPEVLTLVIVPHTYNFDALNIKSQYKGVANYLKDIDLPMSLNKKRIYLKFNSVDPEANIFINGLYVGEHLGGYSAFIVEITDFVKIGRRNNIWVRVNNSPQFSYMPVNESFNQYGGMTGDVQLIATDATSISLTDKGSDGVFLEQTKVSNEKAIINASVKLTTNKPGTYTVSVSAKASDDNQTVARGEVKIKVDKNGSAKIPLEIDNPKLWNGLFEANTYDFFVKVSDERSLLDSMKITTGLRYYTIDRDKGFMLNGKPYKIKGVTYIEDRAMRGSALTRKDIEEDVETMLEMGVNAVRMKNHPHSSYFYELCDKYGIILWSEIPLVGSEMVADDGYINKTSLKNNIKAQLSEMILQHYNNPSVMFWGLFSNISVRGDNPVNFVRELNDLSHQIDPTRLTIASSNQDGDINFVTDLISWSQYLGWTEGAVSDVGIWLTQLNTEWPKLRSAIGEYGAGGSVTHQDEYLRRPGTTDLKHSERWQTNYHEKFYSIVSRYPSIWGSFINSMFDYGSVTYVGGDIPGICDMGLVTYDRRSKKDAFYFYKAVWNQRESFVYITEKRWDKRKQTSQSIKVFSNQSEVELVVNGVSAGKATSSNGVFKWDKIDLSIGKNTIEAISGQSSDKSEITILTKQL